MSSDRAPAAPVGGMSASRAGDTRARLQDAALRTIREEGIARVSARTVAARADCNQASIYYHFGSLHALLTEASLQATEQRVDVYRERLAAVGSLRELVELARAMHAEERELGNVTVLAQMLAGGQTDAELREPTAAALQLWIDEVERTLQRLLADTPLNELIDVHGFARTVSAAFIGIELMDGISGAEEPSPLDTLDQLVELIESLLGVGGLGGTAVRWQMGRRRRQGR